MKKLFLVCLLLLIITNCSGNYTQRDRLNEAVFIYNQGMRWNKLDSASNYISDEQRETLLEHYTKMQQDIQIVDYDVVETQLNPATNSAKVKINLTWVSQSSQELFTTLLEQHWEERDGEWKLVSEDSIGGHSI